MKENITKADFILSVIAGTFLGAFCFGVFLFFIGVLVPSGVVVSTDDHYFRELVSASSGWAAAAGALYATIMTVPWLKRQYEAMREQREEMRKQFDLLLRQHSSDQIRVISKTYGELDIILIEINDFFLKMSNQLAEDHIFREDFYDFRKSVMKLLPYIGMIKSCEVRSYESFQNFTLNLVSASQKFEIETFKISKKYPPRLYGSFNYNAHQDKYKSVCRIYLDECEIEIKNLRAYITEFAQEG